MNRLMVATGGTGGHVFPALAVIGAVKRLSPECDVLFLGGGGPEAEWCARAGVRFAALPAKGFMGKGLGAVSAAFTLLRGLAKALGILAEFKPQAAVGFGGYASLAPLLAARLLGVPLAVHEQNSVPGVANRVLARLARRVFASFADQRGCFPAGKVVLTGNPIRPEIAALAGQKRKAPGRNLLVLGGTQGAMALNDAVLAALPALADAGATVRLQTGPRDHQRVAEACRAGGFKHVEVCAFIDDMAGAYAWADLALCRAGASTVFETAAAGLPAVFVPYPHATHDHQAVNASVAVRAGAARMILQRDLAPEFLAKTVSELFDDPKALEAMGAAALTRSAPGAAEAIAGGVRDLARAA